MFPKYLGLLIVADGSDVPSVSRNLFAPFRRSIYEASRGHVLPPPLAIDLHYSSKMDVPLLESASSFCQVRGSPGLIASAENFT